MASFLNELLGFPSEADRHWYFKAQESKFRQRAADAELVEDRQMYVRRAIEAESQAEGY